MDKTIFLNYSIITWTRYDVGISYLFSFTTQTSRFHVIIENVLQKLLDKMFLGRVYTYQIDLDLCVIEYYSCEINPNLDLFGK